jgi:EAL domain-containing protein (putative c-di-GMP-specific phosphodiesterase class I)/GGDEF domain-containing protein
MAQYEIYSGGVGAAHSVVTPTADHPKEGLAGLNFDDDMRRHILNYGQRYDIQTGLLNYPTLQEALGSQLRHTPPACEVATVWIDVLNLRREFSLWGWAAAEAMARNVADALRTAVDGDSLLGRFNGRCFVFSMRASKSDPGAYRRIQKVVDAVAALGTCELEASPEVAAGVAFFPSDSNAAEDLLRFASLAASRARFTQSPVVLAFEAGMDNLLRRDHQLQVEIAKGLDDNQLSTHFQPKVDLATGRILGAEALMRWNHPEWGAVPPSDFIPVAERSHLIHRIFDLSLRLSLKEVRRWQEAGIAPGLIAVNVSAANLRREDFPDRARNLLAEFPIGPVELELEVTESLLLDDEELFTARMHQLKALGIRLAIDDFGTRYTGFNLLKRLPLDAMKIDRCFIRGIHGSQDMRALCNTIVAMARQMKLRTVAEGLEDPAELDVMQQIGCDAGQGFLFQHPLPAEEFAHFLREWPDQNARFLFADKGESATMQPLHATA